MDTSASLEDEDIVVGKTIRIESERNLLYILFSFALVFYVADLLFDVYDYPLVSR